MTDIKSGELIDAWAQLPYLQRLRVRFSVDQLWIALQTLESEPGTYPDWYARATRSIPATPFENLLVFRQLPEDGMVAPDDPTYPFIAEQREIAEMIERKGEELRSSEGEHGLNAAFDWRE